MTKSPQAQQPVLNLIINPLRILCVAIDDVCETHRVIRHLAMHKEILSLDLLRTGEVNWVREEPNASGC